MDILWTRARRARLPLKLYVCVSEAVRRSTFVRLSMNQSACIFACGFSNWAFPKPWASILKWSNDV